jgi:hypothetical protein
MFKNSGTRIFIQPALNDKRVSDMCDSSHSHSPQAD